MSSDPFDQSVDDLLADIHRMIDDDPAQPMPDELDFDLDDLYEAPKKPDPGPDILPPPRQQPAYWTQTQKLPKHVAKLQKNQAQAYADWLYEQDSRQPAASPEKAHWSQTQRLPKHVAKLQQDQQSAYSQWLDAQGREPDPDERPHSAATYEELPDYDTEPPMKKKRHGFRNFVCILLLLAVIVTALVVFVLPSQPRTADAGLGARRDGVSTILLAGTDQGGARTDTLMLLTMDRPNQSLSLVSIPRDTLVNGSYAVPKINSVYGANNGGDEGIEMLMTRVAQCIGFRPDGYMLIQLDAFVELVDALGGVTFDVPVDMYYNDPAQNLYIDLAAGTQTLTGEEAMGVVRFRSGYADADLGRVQVQRSFLSALIRQAVSVQGVAKSPMLLNILMEHTDSDLTVSNYLWLAESALLCDLSDIQTVTLPGTARMLNGGSYYILDAASVAQTVNTYCNPYEAPVTTEQLSIRIG